MESKRTTAAQRCMDDCCQCVTTCLETLTYCVTQGGSCCSPQLIGLLQDCADICQTACNCTARRSTSCPKICTTCAEICLACATACEQVKGDKSLANCAEVCRHCAESCKAGTLSMGARASH
jgi:hypothetical protein